MPKLTAEQRAELRAEVQRVRTILRGASVPKDIFGKRMVVPATCGHCHRSWNDAAISELTPVPAGRCPFEYAHIYSEES
jgi:hypothetical protein